ncbi:MAG TPA: hypothetical protein VGR78_13040 [Verrucomicrobiae bacterium]|jgi:hypothetical protein|nr:hypothetical protein [Verrucomicrobiae bacterium]
MRLPLTAILFLSVWSAQAQSTNTPAKNDFQSFQIIAQRNIFDPNRSARGGRGEPRETSKPARTESFGLVGTMLYEKGKFAFFDGSSSDFRKIASPSDKIAGYTVTDIEQNAVKLETNGQSLQMTVGQQMKRADEGEWKLSATKETFETQSKSAPSTESSATASSSSGDDDAVVRRLMEKRAAEEKK